MTTQNSYSSKQSETPDQTNLVNQATRSVRWSILYNVAPRLVTPFSTIVLAALLTPADFGLVAISTFIIAFARIIMEMGMSKAVIQRRTHVDEAASINLWLSLFISLILYFALWFASPWISNAYNNDTLRIVIRVATLSLPLTAMATVPKALLQRKMDFRSLFWVNTSFLITQGVASVLLAQFGIGYWALIWGQMIALLISAGLAWIYVRWRPKIFIRWSVLRSTLGFSIWVMFSSFQNWLFQYADNAIAGLFLGVRGLGIYSFGFSISIIIPGFLVASLGDVAYPAFCELQESPKEVGNSLMRLQMLTGVLLFPIAFGVSAIAPSVVDLLYGQKWEGLGTVIGLLVIMPGLSYIWSLNEKAYQAVGRPDVWTKLSGITLLVLLPLLWVVAPYGLLAFTLARFGGAILLPLGNMFFGGRVIGIGVREQMKVFGYPLSISAVMYAFVYCLIIYLGPFDGLIGWTKILGIVVGGAIVYLVLFWRTNQSLWNQLFLSMRRVLA